MVERKAADVLNLKYMKKNKHSLNFIGVWPNKVMGDRSVKSQVLSSFHFVFRGICIIILFSQILYIKINPFNLKFIHLGHTYITTAMTVVLIQRLFLPLQNNFCEIMKEFVFNFHLDHHKQNSDYTVNIKHRVTRICHILTMVCHYQMFFGIILFNVVPVLKNYMAGMYTSERPVNSTFEQAVYYYLPFDQYSDPLYYALVFCYNWFASFYVCCGHMCVDLLITIIVMHIWGHLSILKYKLDSFPQPKFQIERTFWYTVEENHEVFQRLKKIIEYHEMIKLFMSKTSEAYGITLCLYYAFHQIVGCVLLLECSTMNPEALGKYGPLTVVTFQQLVQLSVIFELIGSKGDTLVDAVYSLPWECMDYRNRRLVLLLLQNVQVPLSLKAGDMIPVGVTTMSAVIKTSLSYFMMLRTLGQ